MTLSICNLHRVLAAASQASAANASGLQDHAFVVDDVPKDVLLTAEALAAPGAVIWAVSARPHNETRPAAWRERMLSPSPSSSAWVSYSRSWWNWGMMHHAG